MLFEPDSISATGSITTTADPSQLRLKDDYGNNGRHSQHVDGGAYHQRERQGNRKERLLRQQKRLILHPKDYPEFEVSSSSNRGYLSQHGTSTDHGFGQQRGPEVVYLCHFLSRKALLNEVSFLSVCFPFFKTPFKFCIFLSANAEF